MKHFLAIGIVAAMGISLGTPSAEAGSIYKTSRQEQRRTALFDDYKARCVGDIVTIQIVESNSASEVSQVGTDKSHDFNLTLSSLFGAGKKLFGAEDGATLTEGKFSGSNEFEGQAKTSNSGNVTAQLTATVKEVLPNGNLLLEGRRAINFNKEKKNIVLTGIVRPQDISATNTVKSTYIAEAAITFEGFGEVNDQARPGLLSRILNLIPLF